jgi:hypothetical protein
VEEANDFGEERRLSASTSRPAPGRRQAIVSWLIAAALLAWLAAQIDLPVVKAGLRVIYPGWLGAALLSVVAAVVLRVARWRALLMGAPGVYPAWASLWRATLWGQGLNLLLPLRAGDLARAYGVKHTGRSGAAYALGTIGAEKLLDLAWLCAALLSLFLFPAHSSPSERGGLWGGNTSDLSALLPASHVAIPLLAMGGILTLAWLLGRASLPAGQGWPAWRRAAVDGLGRLGAGLTVLSRPSVLWPAMAWSVPLWLGHAFNNYATARALAMPMDWRGALLVLVVLQAGLAPPSTPAKIGTFQALCVASLSWLGHSLAMGLAYGLVLQLVVMLPPLALLLLDLSLERWA